MLASSVVSALGSVCAQEETAFYQKNVAKEFWGTEVTEKAGTLSLLKPIKEKDLKEAETAKLNEEGEIVPVKANIEDDSPPKTEAEWRKRFGDPNKPHPIKAKSDAPLPYMGLTEAIRVGNYGMAEKYAKQYVRYMRDVQNNAKISVGFMGKAMEEEGILTANSWQNSSEFKAYRDSLKTANDKPEHKQKSIDEEAKWLVEKMVAEEKERMEVAAAPKNEREAAYLEMQANKEEEEEGFEEPVKPTIDPEEIKVRKKIRQEILAKQNAKPDPKGEVDVYFFLRSNDQASEYMATNFQELYTRYKDNNKIRLAGLTLELESGSSVSAYRARTKAGFPIANGTVMAKSLGVDSVPTIIFISRTTGQAIAESGARPFLYLDEMAKVISGGK
jgi:hypothetical protein